MKLANELIKFWQWANMTPDEYSETPDFGNWETGYLNWVELYQAASETIDIINCNDSADINKLLNLILDAITIDNEEGKIINECENRLNDIEPLLELSINHTQPEARRQIAELLGRNKIYGKTEVLLRELVYDKSVSVRRSALISLCKVNHIEAERIAFENLHDNEEYVRLFSIRVLSDLNSSKLLQAKELLREDKSIFVQNELNSITIRNY